MMTSTPKGCSVSSDAGDLASDLIGCQPTRPGDAHPARVRDGGDELWAGAASNRRREDQMLDPELTAKRSAQGGHHRLISRAGSGGKDGTETKTKARPLPLSFRMIALTAVSP
jgi:hypothetical protein